MFACQVARGSPQSSKDNVTLLDYCALLPFNHYSLIQSTLYFMNPSPPGPSTWAHGLPFPLFWYSARMEPRALHMLGVRVRLHCQADWVFESPWRHSFWDYPGGCSQMCLTKEGLRQTWLTRLPALGSVAGKGLSLLSLTLRLLGVAFSSCFPFPSLCFFYHGRFYSQALSHKPSFTLCVLLVRCLVVSTGRVANTCVKRTQFQNVISD